MQGQLWLPLGDRFYRIELDTNVQQWRIKHPRGTQPYSPVIEHHGGGAGRGAAKSRIRWAGMKPQRSDAWVQPSNP